MCYSISANNGLISTNLVHFNIGNKIMLEYKKFDTQKVTRSAQEIAENLTSLHKSANATFQDNFISCYLPLWELLKWRKNEIAKYTPEYVKSLNNGKTSVQLKAELDASILLCTLDKKGKRVDN